jgi:hypothetical protein
MPSGTFYLAIQTVRLVLWGELPYDQRTRQPCFSRPFQPGGPTLTPQVHALLDHIRALDKPMDEARVNKIENIKKALADGTYHVSAAEVARKIIDSMREP